MIKLGILIMVVGAILSIVRQYEKDAVVYKIIIAIGFCIMAYFGYQSFMQKTDTFLKESKLFPIPNKK